MCGTSHLVGIENKLLYNYFARHILEIPVETANCTSGRSGHFLQSSHQWSSGDELLSLERKER